MLKQNDGQNSHLGDMPAHRPPPRETDTVVCNRLDETPCIETVSGVFFPLSLTESPPVEVIVMTDIAHSLAQTNRFVGHASLFYSVGLHSLMTVDILASAGYDAKYQAIGLLHDAAEYVLNDVSQPLKSLLPDYKRIERLVRGAIFKRYNLEPTPEELRLVKIVDDLLLRFESSRLMPSRGRGWNFIYEIEELEELERRVLGAWRNVTDDWDQYVAFSMKNVETIFMKQAEKLLGHRLIDGPVTYPRPKPIEHPRHGGIALFDTGACPDREAVRQYELSKS